MKKLSGFLFALLFGGNVYALDGVSLELGNGQQTDILRVGALWNMNQSWLSDGDWHVTGYWEVSAAKWQGRSSVGNNQTITDLGVTPVFRFSPKVLSPISPYLEGAIGVHLISPTFIYDNRHFGGAFQFGDHLGAGLLFGERHQYDLAYRFQHLSNAGLKQPNQGINLNEIHFAYHF
jgi:lipid A 3-O-deacylase